MKVTMKFDVSKLTKDIKKWNNVFEKKLEDVIVITALQDIEEVARQNLYSGGHVDTTRLVNSLHTSIYGNTAHHYKALPYSTRYNRGKLKTNFNGTLSEKPKNRKEVLVGTRTPYSQYIHRKCTPYLLNALEQSRNKFIDRLKKLI